LILLLEKDMGKNWPRGKVVVITGGASGIGAALAYKFGKEGARIALLDTDAAALKEQERKLTQEGVTAIARKCDISSEPECSAAIAAIIQHYGGIDLLFNNAGITHRGPFLEANISTIRRVMDVNFFGALHCTKAALESLLSRKGMIVITSSIAGLAPLLGRTAYCASKHALQGLFSTLRAELKETGVHVMIVCPGFTRTNLQTKALDGKGQFTPYPRSMIGQEASPSEVAEAIFRGVEKRKSLLVLTPVGKLSYYLFRMVPQLYERWMARKLREEIQR
jgi:NAD(P)-dependent dehydrogenase (short-subunit alcohol dehydrogenase family)